MSQIVRELEGFALPFGAGKVRRFELLCTCGKLFTGRSVGATCDACQAASERAVRRAAEEAASEQRVRDTAATVPPRYQWATFESELLPGRVRSAKGDAIARARKAVGALSVVLLGPAGSGKTVLACAILMATAAQLKTRGRFASTFTLAKARQEHPLGEGESPVVHRAANAKVLVLDELAAEFGRNTAVQEVIHDRHAHDLPTIYTSGFSPDEISKRYGDGIARRVFEGATVIPLGAAK